MGDHINTAVALAHLGECNLCLGHFDLAEKFNKEALLEAQAVEVAANLTVLAAIKARQGAHTEASALLRQVLGAGPHLAGWLEK